MKIKLYVVNHEELEGLYTESELEDLKQELLEDYRECPEFLDDLFNSVEPRVLVCTALGDEEPKKTFDFEVEKIEETYWENFIKDYVITYEKEL